MAFWNRRSKAKPQPKRAPQPQAKRGYDGAGKGYRTDNWNTSGASANSEIGASLVDLRKRSRDLYQNAPYGKKAMRGIVRGLIGVKLRPYLPRSKNEAAALDLYRRWEKRCYAHSRLGIGGIQHVVADGWVESGECLVRKSVRSAAEMPGLPPFQLQVLESDFLDETRDNKNTIQGVEFDPTGAPSAYWLHRRHPGDSTFASGLYSTTEVGRVPAAQIAHLARETRPGQVRGVPFAHAVIMATWDLDGYNDANRVRSKGAACHMASVSGGTEDEDVENPDGMGMTTTSNGTLVTDSDGHPVEDLRPGGILYAPDGKEITFHSPPAAQDHEATNRVALREIASGLDQAYESLSGDLSGVNFSSIKFGLNNERLEMKILRQNFFVPLFLDVVWNWFIEEAILAGLLPNDPSLYDVEWSEPEFGSADRSNDAKADAIEIRNGLASRSQAVARRGGDITTINDQLLEDRKWRMENDLVLDSDPGQTSGAGLYYDDKLAGGQGQGEEEKPITP